jgi:hypothetical protein
VLNRRYLRLTREPTRHNSGQLARDCFSTSLRALTMAVHYRRDKLSTKFRGVEVNKKSGACGRAETIEFLACLSRNKKTLAGGKARKSPACYNGQKRYTKPVARLSHSQIKATFA